ncbi:MAG: undecaprenyl/decaprenyl-phosphate alpha-N-acetylglucosaminyl 1-phosphate transferase [Deltaproteobacteria bacterium]|nr:undecaprenyl/decaprenyl-phosphate alpha-N-acetylglucosaminyl 1-phosphate transferase [Deltaproteobacteria bacterium]
MKLVWLQALLFGFGFVLCGALVPLFRQIATKTDLVDRPGGRKLQQKPVPYLGGAAVFAGLLGAFLLAVFGLGTETGRSLSGQFISLEKLAPRPVAERATVLLALAAGMTVIFVTGLLDDWKGAAFPVWAKLAGQSLAALLVVLSGVHIEIFNLPGLDHLVTFLWIVGITNAFNLLDNMDGLSSAIAVISSICFWIVAFSLGQWLVASLLAVFAGTISGFIPFNWHRASIYLGDAGSLLIGFFLGSMTVIQSYIAIGEPLSLAVLMPLLVLAIPLFDTFSVIVIRMRNGQPVYQGDRNHLSHRLVRIGLSIPEAVLFLCLLQIVTGFGAVLLPRLTFGYGWLVLVQNIIVVMLVSMLMFFGGKGADGR